MLNDNQFTHTAEVEDLSERDDARAKMHAIEMIETLVRITREDGQQANVGRALKIMAAALGYVMLSMEAQERDGNPPPCGSPCDPITFMNISAIPALTYLQAREEEGWEMPGQSLASRKPEGHA